MGRNAGGEPRANNHAVQATELTKTFGDFTAVDRVTFTIERGVIFGFLGPNGAGKTTTIRMLLGLLGPTSGAATVLGFAHTVGEFGVVLMIGGNIPGETQVLSIAIYDHVEALEYGQAHWLAGGLLALSFVMLVTVYAVNPGMSPFKYSLRIVVFKRSNRSSPSGTSYSAFTTFA